MENLQGLSVWKSAEPHGRVTDQTLVRSYSERLQPGRRREGERKKERKKGERKKERLKRRHYEHGSMAGRHYENKFNDDFNLTPSEMGTIRNSLAEGIQVVTAAAGSNRGVSGGGVYVGKAGVALALMELARVMQLGGGEALALAEWDQAALLKAAEPLCRAASGLACMPGKSVSVAGSGVRRFRS